MREQRALRGFRALVCAAAALLLGCRPAPAVETALPECPAPAQYDTAGWRRERHPELTLAVPPLYGAPERRVDAPYGVTVSWSGPERSLFFTHATTAPSLTRDTSGTARPPCTMRVGGRRAVLKVWHTNWDQWSGPGRRNYLAAVRWEPPTGDSGLVVIARVRDSSALSEALAVVQSAELPPAWRDSATAPQVKP